MNNRFKGLYIQLLILLGLSVLIFQFETGYTILKRAIFPSFVSPRLLSKIDFHKDSEIQNSEVKSIYTQNNRVLIISGSTIDCLSVRGDLLWRREVSGSKVTVVSMGENTLIIDMLRGDLSLINMDNEIIVQKKDIGEINQITTYKDKLVAVSNFKNRKIQVFNSSLERVGVIDPPPGEIVRFKFSKVEPRLLVYETEMINNQLRSFIYHYNSELKLIASNDLDGEVVYDFEFLKDLIIIGSNWIGTVDVSGVRELNSEKISYKVSEIKGLIESTGGNESQLAVQYLVTEGEDQGKSKLVLLDKNNNVSTIPLKNQSSDQIILGERYVIVRELQTIFVYDNEFKERSEERRVG